MKKILFSILCAFMVSTMASAQYLNVKLDDGTWRSFKTSSKTEVSFGEKKGVDPTESTQTVTVNGHTVAVKLADDTPASEVMLSIYAEDEKVKIEAYSKWNLGLWCSMDDNGEDPVTYVYNGFHTFTLSDISNNVVVTVGYITVRFDLNNSNMADNFKPKPADITKMAYNSTIPPTYASAEKHSFRGWYTDKECKSPWNYSTGVTKSMTLYAKWTADPTGNKINEHEFVKLGGYYWATENVSSDEYNRVYHHDTYGNLFNQCQGKSTDYNAFDNNALNAANSWGSEGNYTWTLPSEAQWQALIDYCDWTWTTDDETGMNGMLVKGREGTYESEHRIFLPAAGIYDVGRRDVLDQGYRGYYWSTDNGRSLYFSNGFRGLEYGILNYGLAVRPVSE